MLARLVFASVFLPLAAFAQTPASVVQASFDGPTYGSGNSMGGPNLWLGIRTQAQSTLVVTRVEIFTGLQHGTNSLSIWTHDAITNTPQQLLGTGSWDMSWVNGWQGTAIQPPVVLQQGQDLWVVWAPINGSQSSLTGISGGGPLYRGSFDNGQTWNGPFQGPQWKFRLWTGDAVGSFEVLGTGCASSARSVPEIGFDGIPLTGHTCDVLLSRGVPGGFGLLGLGLSSSSWLGTPLPASLAPFGGGANCYALASMEGQLSAVADASGVARVTLTMPNNAGLIGWNFYDQWWLFDSAASTLGIITSNALRGTIGF